ncbi:MAG: ATPase [Acidobacteria bacterium]|nr:ATPase [Acidobacteriota bacterium]
MPDARAQKKIAIVTGDVTIDWNLRRFRQRQDSASQSCDRVDTVRASSQCGGAALVAGLIDAVAETLRRDGGPDFEVRRAGASFGPAQLDDERMNHSYALWSQYKRTDGKALAWRVEESLGVDPGSRECQVVADDTSETDLVVLDDADLGFRNQKEMWPRALVQSRRRPWILLKMARPVAQGELWEHLLEQWSDRLIVVMTVNDLRRTEVKISRELSWERTVQDLFWELTHNPRVNSLSRIAHIVVSFDTAGAWLHSRADSTCKLIYDPTLPEGAWNQNLPGGMIGYTSCLAGSLARQVMIRPEDPDLVQGIQAGIAAMRVLHQQGYEERAIGGKRAGLSFPHEAIAKVVAAVARPFDVVDVQDPSRFISGSASDGSTAPESAFWTILQDRCAGSLDSIAEDIVLKGPETALRGVPLGQFEDLITADRHEIESFRCIRSLFIEYCGQSQQRPLSIGVFGPPGSGKSFGVKQVARSVRSSAIKPLEFNLSQFDGQEALFDALHQVRDVALSGQIPLVFWDEFDTALAGRPLGWLRYFLAPMQDGFFQQGQIAHPIGRAIFVFAGGTCARMEDFGGALSREELVRMKGPDFLSRLKGYINILGLNPQVPSGKPVDSLHVIRRAMVLRSVLSRTVRHIFQKQGGALAPSIDPGVLRAFLHTREYKHGARSLEAVIGMSLLAGRSAFERSCLPSEAQLELHVDGRDFMALTQQMRLDGPLLERLAEAAHEVFCDNMKSNGYRYGPKNDEILKTNSAIKPYQQLAEDEKEQNRGNVRDIPNKLSAVSYVMMPARSNERPFEFPGPDLDLLSKMEHDRWMQAKIGAGWSYSSDTNKANKQHEALLPWEQLPEGQKERDRFLVRDIPRILAKAGYAVLKSHI